MKKIQCEMCGGTTIKKVDDTTFECQNCGIQYTKEEVQKLFVEITGEVRIDHTKDVDNSIKRGEYYENLGDIKTATEYYNKALDMDPENSLAIEKLNKFRENSWNGKIEHEIETYLEKLDEFEKSFNEADQYYNDALNALYNKSCEIAESLGVSKQLTMQELIDDEEKLNAFKKYLYETTKIYEDFDDFFKSNFKIDTDNPIISEVYEKLWYVNLYPQEGDSAAHIHVQKNYINLCALLWVLGYPKMEDWRYYIDYNAVLPMRYSKYFGETFKNIRTSENEYKEFAWNKKRADSALEILNINDNDNDKDTNIEKDVFVSLDLDPLYEKAKNVVTDCKQASASLLQRKLSIGYATAMRLIDQLEANGIIGPYNGAAPRKVLANDIDTKIPSNKLTVQQAEKMFADVDGGMTEEILDLAHKYGKDNPFYKMYRKAVLYVAEKREVSEWSLSSALNIGTKNAGKVMDMMIENGLISKDGEIYIYPSRFVDALKINTQKRCLIGQSRKIETSYVVCREFLQEILKVVRENPTFDLPMVAANIRNVSDFGDRLRGEFNEFAEWYRRVIIDKEEI